MQHGQQLCTGGQYDAYAPQPINEDCDGLDNGVTAGWMSHRSTCNSECGGGIELCQMGTFSGCDAPSPVEEICVVWTTTAANLMRMRALTSTLRHPMVIPYLEVSTVVKQGREQCIGGTYDCAPDDPRKRTLQRY